MRSKLLRVPVLPALLLAACAVPPEPQKTQLEIREFQTRDFDTPDAKLVMKAMLNVLQDEGYVVKNAVVDLGLITAAKEIDLNPNRTGGDDGIDVFGSGTVIFGGPGGVIIGGSPGGGTWRKTEVVECTSNVSERGPQTRVRISFQRRILDNRGNTMRSEQIDEAPFYQEFFAKVDKAIFLQKEQL
jgi:hypothetical protein